MGSVQPKIGVPNKGLAAVFKTVSTIEIILLLIACLFLLMTLVAVAGGIISREMFNKPILWTNDLAAYSLSYLVFLGAPWVLKHRGHVQVDILTQKLKGMLLRVNTFIIAAVSGVIFALFFWFSLDSTITLYQRGTVMMNNIQWPKFALIAPLAVGSFFIVIRFILILIETIGNFEEPGKEGQEEGHVELV